MLKIVFIINSELYVRNYLSSNVLSPLLMGNQLTFLVKSNVELVGDFNKFNIIRYEADLSNDKKKHRIFNILMYKYKHRSSSFRYRILRSKVFLSGELKWGLRIRDYLVIMRGMLARFIDSFINQFFSLFSEKFILNYFNGDSVNNSLRDHIMTINPDIVVLPSSAYASEDIEFSSICKKKMIPSFLLVDNWDNLSSKSILWSLPNYVGVWGEQSKNHAISIQKFKSENVLLMGSARYDSYFLLRNESLQSHYDFPYVLFVGTSLYFDEIQVLKILDAEISQNRDIYGSLKVVYRPHPWRQKKEVFPQHDFTSVVLDGQMKNAILGAGVKYQPSLDYYPSLLKNAKFVIGGMTSMVIESLIFRKKFLGLIYDEKYITSPNMVFSNYEHFRGIENLSFVSLCESLHKLPEFFLKMYQNDGFDNNYDECDSQRNFILYNNNESYAERLMACCLKISRGSQTEI